MLMCSIFFLKMIKKIMKSNLPLKYNIKRRIDRVKSSLSQAVTFDSIVVEKMVFIIHPFFFMVIGVVVRHISLR
jgi:hypothetical protein